MKNPQLQELIIELKKASIQNDAPVWKRIATILEGSTQRRPVVNLSKIEKYARDEEIILVPGKVLSMGILTKKITIAAHTFSHSAVEKIKASGSKAITLHELLKKNPDGSKVRILG
jgi:large subunit ribosomal protein L18e